MTNDYLCKKCKLKQNYYENINDDGEHTKNDSDNNTLLVYEDLVGPYEKLIPDTSVTIFSLVCLGIVLLFGR